MVVGALGPWATLLARTVLQRSVTGMDSPNHGRFVVAFAAIGALALADYLRVQRLWKAACTTVAGAAGVAITLHDRHHLERAFSIAHISVVQALQSFVHLRWGLNLALCASAAMGLAAFVLVLVDRFSSVRRLFRGATVACRGDS